MADCDPYTGTMPKRSSKSAQTVAMRQKRESLRDQGLDYTDHIVKKIRLERELGRPICGYLVRGEPCHLPQDHPERLHSGDFQ
jgi:hypothetical protein